MRDAVTGDADDPQAHRNRAVDARKHTDFVGPEHPFVDPHVVDPAREVVSLGDTAGGRFLADDEAVVPGVVDDPSPLESLATGIPST